MSLQPRSKSAAPARSKAVKPHRKGTAGKPTSTASPRKREKTNARSIERAKRFADTHGSAITTERQVDRSDQRSAERSAPQASNFAPARRNDRTSLRGDTRPTTRREASVAHAQSGDGRPNFEPKKRTKFIPGGKRTGTSTRSTHSGIATPNNHSFNRPSASRNTDNFSPRPHKGGNKSGGNFANNHFNEDFGVDDNYITDVQQESTVEASHHTPNESTNTTFADLGIAQTLVQLLTSQGINSPFPIQIATLPDAIVGHDILGRGQTGSGKTLAFALAILTRLEGKQAAPHRPLALILTPTRELALQINDVITPLARAVRLDSVVIAGGMPYAKQITAMRKSCPILVATPGRLIDLLNRGEVQLEDLQITVLDEADQMADMGFLPVVKEILDQAKPNGQRLLFSATLDRGVDSLVKKYLNNPKTHSLQNDRASVSTMEHHVLVMHPGDKDEITAQIASRDGRTILFVKTQRGADRLADKLASVGVAVGALHGGKSQAVRTRTLAHFKANTNGALVATDVAARGIHVDDVSLVVHVDAPTDHKDYLHRAGRTARAGEAGVVVTLATSKQQTAVRGLTARAGVYPKFVDVRPHHAELVLITGSKEPSGIAYIAPVAERAEFGGARRKPRPNSDQRRRRPR
jgi:superfamily II DNA/RNA helicase